MTRPTRRSRGAFHDLTVGAIERLTDDAMAITFEVAPRLRDVFDFSPGQHLTVRLAGPPEIRRSYSICSTPRQLRADGALRVGVRAIPGGAFSTFARALRVGDALAVMPPLGHFTTDISPEDTRHHAAVVAGSGITPVLSLASTVLATAPASRFTLIYGNRTSRSVMFAEELADLKDRYPDRLHLVYAFSREELLSPLLSGRLDLARILESGLVDVSDVDEWFLCGPYALVTAADRVLVDAGVPARAVHTELFHVSEAPPPPVAIDASATVATATAVIVLDGRQSTVELGPGERVLEAALRVRAELPYACKGGVCSTCRALLVEGEVTMAQNYALEPAEVAAGYILTCQATPRSGRLVVDYDA